MHVFCIASSPAGVKALRAMAETVRVANQAGNAASAIASRIRVSRTSACTLRFPFSETGV